MKRGLTVALTITIVVLLALFLMLEAIHSADRARGKADELEQELSRSQAEAQKLNAEANELQLQVRGLQLLYANAEKYATQNGHEVSKDGRLEMFTWRNNSTGQICAHWCAHKTAGDGQCNEVGPDRCIP